MVACCVAVLMGPSVDLCGSVLFPSWFFDMWLMINAFRYGLLSLNLCAFACIVRVFLLKSMIGLCWASHGRPRITSSSPSAVIMNRCRCLVPAMFIGEQVKWVIMPPWFVVPSTFRGDTGWERLYLLNGNWSAIVVLMNTPSAPESINAFSWMSSPFARNVIGIRIELLLLLVTVTRAMLGFGGGTCILLLLPTENPSSPTSQRVH